MKKTTKKTTDTLREMVNVLPVVVSVHKAEDGGYWVEAPLLGGCFSAGKTLSEALHNFKFAIFEYFDVPTRLQKPDSLELRALDIPEPKNSKKPAVASFFPTTSLASA